MVFRVWLILILLGLGGCQVPYPSNNKDAYLKSKNGPKLVVPPPLQQNEISSFYYLPNADGHKKVSIKP
jgi:uncharacterized lipoprotein